MNKIAATSMNTLRLLPRAALILAMLAAPVLAVPAARGSTGTTIEAPAHKKVGAGFVLLMSLQRG
ncbi:MULTISPECIES: hypothetical protein [unclassified Mesorhizobium]|jgi:hypothetical protein|uniref:hypothetical protein n=1 Tax=unclassified Mesorhizobium TaxID=325217 RepID=UPI0008E5B6EA|nr:MULTISPECIES: hypothetical protein [unclassified Mesorhizobium]RJG45855.1 hypothetical protein D3Y55_17420 [Mesorhizobium sp. DCY119]SFT97046.1 hypothetical protein SAMN05518861_108200 [Mesorhizobium sp. YR577]